MGLLGVQEWFLIAYLCVLLPWMAVRSRRQVRGLESADAAEREATRAKLPPGLVRLLAGTLVQLVLLGAFCWMLAPRWGYAILAPPARPGLAVSLGVAALACHFALFALARAWRTPEERRRAVGRHLVPRTPQEWAMAVAVVLAAATAEELAYRGLGMLFLTIAFGTSWGAAAVMALAFGAAHALQGRKAMAIVVAMALSMHLLVALTDTLVVAMAVHLTYDIAALLLTRRAIDREAAAGAGAAATA